MSIFLMLMIQDIHRGDDGLWTVQPVDVDRGSKLFDVMGADHVRTYSGHHQGVKRVASRLKVSAVAPDGMVEGTRGYWPSVLFGCSVASRGFCRYR
jgi:gamma-glutamyl-gamma-aminobutyrate hydrolase PuuD